MLKEEINYLLTNIEIELLEFVNFIKDVEDTYKNISPDYIRKPHPSKHAGTYDLSDKKNDILRTSALFDSFNILNNLLAKIYNLISKVSSIHAANCEIQNSKSSHLQNFHYEQYVYHIVLYLVKMVEEHLCSFSEKVKILASPRPAQDSNEQPSQKKKLPFSFKFKTFKPATVFCQDGSIYKHPQPKNYKSGLKSSPYEKTVECDCPGSAFDKKYKNCCQKHKDYRQEYNAEKYKDNRDGKILHDKRSPEESKNEIVIRLTKSLNSLIYVLEELLLHLRNWIKPQSNLPFKDNLHRTSSERKKIISDRPLKPCCSTTCSKCCHACRALHAKERSYTPKYKTKEQFQQQKSSWKGHMLPLLNLEPFWMYTNPDKNYQEKKSASSKRKNEKPIDFAEYFDLANISSSSKEQETQDYGTQFPSNAKQSSAIASEENQPSFPFGRYRKRRTSSLTHFPQDGEKIDASDYFENKAGISRPQLTCITQKVGKQESSIEIFRGIKRNISSREKIYAEYSDRTPKEAKPKMKDVEVSTASDIPRDYKSSKRYRDDENEDLDPHAVVFDVIEFAHLLQKKLQDHFAEESTSEESDSKTILDLVVNCLKESDDIDLRTQKPQKQGLMTQDKSMIKGKLTLDNFVMEVMDVATEIAQVKKLSKCRLVPEEEETLQDIQNLDVFTTGSRSSERRIGILMPEPRAKQRRKSSMQACEECNSLPMSITAAGMSPDSEKYRTKKTLKGSCFQCWNVCHKGLTIHQCHDMLPSGIFEIRHMDANCKICVCYQTWDESKEPDDWRWQKSPFYDPTRVELEQGSSINRNPILKVIYGPEGTLVKESLGETGLKTIQNHPLVHETRRCSAMKRKLETGRTKSVSRTWMDLCKISNKVFVDNDGSKKSDKCMLSSDRHIVTKLGRFFDDLYKVGYGKGPPLVLKLRKNNTLNDAYDLLTVQSKIRLNYYRSIRMIIVSEKMTKMPPSSTNYIEEDQSNQVFEMFARKLFATGELHLFEYPSEETNCVYLNPETSTHPQWFTFAGIVMALALLHQKQMNIQLALCTYKCLLDRPLNIYDLEEIDPLFFQQLMWMKDSDINTRKIKMNFVVRDKIRNQMLENELMANGRNIVVTEKNKFRYIDLAVKWKLAERCLSQLKDFRRGFALVLNPCFLTVFSEKELQGLIRRPPDNELFFQESSSNNASKREILRRETW